MLISTKAIVLNHFKYGETGLICNCYTEKEGYMSFLVKNSVGKNKKRSVYNPLNQVEIVYKQRTNHQTLHYFTSIETAYHYTSLYENPIKTTIVFFLTELIQTCLKKDADENKQLFEVLEKNLILFDKKVDNFGEFHLYLMVQIINQMGLSPDLTNSDFPYFDIQNGNFCLIIEKSSQLLAETEKIVFTKIFELDFSQTSKNEFSSNERKLALTLLLRYLELHVNDFKQPKSLEILKQL